MLSLQWNLLIFIKLETSLLDRNSLNLFGKLGSLNGPLRANFCISSTRKNLNDDHQTLIGQIEPTVFFFRNIFNYALFFISIHTIFKISRYFSKQFFALFEFIFSNIFNFAHLFQFGVFFKPFCALFEFRFWNIFNFAHLFIQILTIVFYLILRNFEKQ